MDTKTTLIKRKLNALYGKAAMDSLMPATPVKCKNEDFKKYMNERKAFSTYLEPRYMDYDVEALDESAKLLHNAMNFDYSLFDEFTKTEDTTMNVDKCVNDVITMSMIANVIFNPPATIVFWADGTKTVVKADEREISFDYEKGLAMAIAKKMCGNAGRYYNLFKKWLPEEAFKETEPKEELLNSDS